MSTKKLQALSIIEIPYGDLNWGTDPKHQRSEIYSDIQLWKKYRELDDYKLCGIYDLAQVPWNIHEIVYNEKPNEEVYITLTKQVSDAVYNQLKKGNAVLLTGGYCKDAVGVCGGIQRYLGSKKKIGIIYLDAHSDMSTPDFTHTGILGGMDMASILGFGLQHWRSSAGIAVPYNDNYVILSDFREASVDDDGALPLVQHSNIKCLSTDEFEDEAKWSAEIHRLAKQVDAIYLHIDADILNSIYVPNAACAAKGGPSIFTLMNNIRIIMETGKVLVYGSYGFYFDTSLPGQDSLTLSGLRSVSAGLHNWKEMPDFN